MVLTDLSLRLGGHGDVAEGEGGGDGEHRVALRLIVGHWHITKDLNHTGRKRSKHNFRLLKFTPGCVQRHSLKKKFNSFPTVTISTCIHIMSAGEERCWVVLETINCSTFTLCVGPDSESTKLLATPIQKLTRGKVLRKILSCRKVLFQGSFQTKRIYTAFH